MYIHTYIDAYMHVHTGTCIHILKHSRNLPYDSIATSPSIISSIHQSYHILLYSSRLNKCFIFKVVQCKI